MWRKMFIMEKYKTVSLPNARSCSSLSFVPKHTPVCNEDIKKISNFINSSKKIVVLTGAGISTESGIPDYRSKGVGLYARSTSRPVQFQDFLEMEAVRKRYWARNYVGWPRFSSSRPNETHEALRRLEVDHGKVSCVVTQNVDGLHGKAGSRNVVELHGTAHRVMCLGCDRKVDRHEFQETLARLNPSVEITFQEMRPDGDVELSQALVDGFHLPGCESCGGILKPEIVFFGDNIPWLRIESVMQHVEEADSLLVLGSSLSVFSGLRVVLQAAELSKPIAIINIGETGGDEYADVKVNARCGDVLPKLGL